MPWCADSGDGARNNAERSREMKPHVKLAYLLIVAGMGIFMLERYGLGTLTQNGDKPHLGGFLLGALALAPIVLIVAGCLVFAVGSMRRSR